MEAPNRWFGPVSRRSKHMMHLARNNLIKLWTCCCLHFIVGRLWKGCALSSLLENFGRCVSTLQHSKNFLDVMPFTVQ